MAGDKSDVKEISEEVSAVLAKIQPPSYLMILKSPYGQILVAILISGWIC